MIDFKYAKAHLPELDQIITSYDIRDEFLCAAYAPMMKDINQRITDYDGNGAKYGHQLRGHLQRISDMGQKMLNYLDYPKHVGANFHHAYGLSDMGKLHPDYDPAIWSLPHRPTEEERAQKRLHMQRGLDVLRDALDRHHAPDWLRMHPHTQITIPCLMLFHHEKLTGDGRFKRTAGDLGIIMRVACIVDAYDGDRIQRGHQDSKRTPLETIERMIAPNADDKYHGHFDLTLLQKFADMIKHDL